MLLLHVKRAKDVQVIFVGALQRAESFRSAHDLCERRLHRRFDSDVAAHVDVRILIQDESPNVIGVLSHFCVDVCLRLPFFARVRDDVLCQMPTLFRETHVLRVQLVRSGSTTVDEPRFGTRFRARSQLIDKALERRDTRPCAKHNDWSRVRLWHSEHGRRSQLDRDIRTNRYRHYKIAAKSEIDARVISAAIHQSSDGERKARVAAHVWGTRD